MLINFMISFCQDISIANPKGEGLDGKEVDYGKKCLELFANQDLAMCLSKTACSFSVRFAPITKPSEAGYDAEWQCLQARNLTSHINEKESYYCLHQNASDSA